MPLLLLVLLLPVIVLALTPLLLLQRYRVGTARRLARPWAARLNVVAFVFSVVVFLAAAAVTNFWVPLSFAMALAGLGVGALLGVVGVWLTRWEATPRTLHYTPNRPLVLLVTLVVAARVLYGAWHSLAVLRAGLGADAAVAAFGVPESLAAGALVIGYYLAYGVGVRGRIRKWQGRALRAM